MTSKIVYTGELRTTCMHLSSGSQIVTDAPIDNKGKGEFFSPTDLVATALGSCALTIIGIYCQEHNVPFENAKIDVKKIMASEPRRIDTVELHFDFSGNNWDEKMMKKIMNAAKNCPVAKSLGENVKIEWNVKY
jgi:putative redox protein